jgi:hypothetical protein
MTPIAMVSTELTGPIKPGSNLRARDASVPHNENTIKPM